MSQVMESRPAIDAFLAEHETLSALPDNATHIIRMAGDKNCNTTQLLKLIELDTALAVRILKTVNSAFYSLPNKITRLDRAVAFMGMKAVKEVALSSVLAAMCKSASFGKYSARDLWDHSCGVAILAREFAVQSKVFDPEEAFLAGMLHDVALLLAAQSEVKKSTRLFEAAESGERVFTSIEQEVFGFDHCELGEFMATKWKFPDDIAAAIRWHHHPDQAPEEQQRLCTHIYIADVLCCQANVGCPLTCNQQQVTDEQLQLVQLSPESVAETTAKLPMLLRLHSN
jgi:HD-like signal output (HDOD) protein